MLSYQIGRDGALVGAQAQDGVLCILTEEEFRVDDRYPRRRQMLHSLGSIRYSKAEVYAGCVQGLLRIPGREEGDEPLLAMGFYLQKDSLCLIGGGQNIDLPALLRDRLKEPVTADRLMLLCLELLSDDDILYLQHIEERMASLEERILSEEAERVSESLLRCRKKLSELSAYYEQMGALGELMSSEADGLVSVPAAWDSYVRKMERLQRYTALLRDYAIQLREVYQTQQDAKQTRVMNILTVITALFLPLTLLTGWYGMNFVYMPELRGRYSYPVVMVLAVVIVAAEIVYFKKRKML